jgi:hypothetical protein
MYIATDSELNEADKLTPNDWANLEGLYYGLKPFWETTERLQGHGRGGSHGFIWEVLPALTMLLGHVESKLHEFQASAPRPMQERSRRRANRQSQQDDAEQTPQQAQLNPIVVAYQNAWEMLNKYNNLTDKNHEIYAAATLLNPCLRKRFFEKA